MIGGWRTSCHHASAPALSSRPCPRLVSFSQAHARGQGVVSSLSAYNTASDFRRKNSGSANLFPLPPVSLVWPDFRQNRFAPLVSRPERVASSLSRHAASLQSN